ncbi:MAG: histidine phosphatase family protein [Rhodospirillaceae bacterium]|nr:histidine phosphatase family protein [Rhodospirillaceae bacterium]
MTTRVFLVRHGATVLSAEDRFAGSTDVDLSDEGRRQASSLAERLAGEPVAAVYASPMRRTVETATIAGAPHKLAPQTFVGLREIDHGHWEGLERSQVEERFPDEYAGWEADPFTFAPEGGEAGIHVLARSLPVIREIVVRHTDQTVLVVSHKATIRLLISSLLGFDARGYRDRLDQQPACLNILDFRDTVRARLMLFNDVSHYEGVPDVMLARHLSKWWDAPQTAD